ncbi:ATP-dependent DNA helicase RecG [Bacillaceae bacterium S4-13-58]
MNKTPVEQLPGVGEKVKESLQGIGIESVEDLLYYFPFRYETYEVKSLSELQHDERATIEGKVIYPPSLVFYGRRKSKLTLTLEVESMIVKAVLFNRAFAKDQLQPGDWITVTGKWDQRKLQVTVSQYHKGKAKHLQPIQPVYPLRGDIKLQRLKRWISSALSFSNGSLEEYIPKLYLKQYKLPTLFQALHTMHFPENHFALKHARRRFVFEELFIFQLKMQLLRKKKKEATKGNTKNWDKISLQEFVDQLPFELTDAQKQSSREILLDLKSPFRMNRLLQGDVGSGKTIVAALSVYAVHLSGYQSAIMVPTEILAEQHYQSLSELFNNRVKVVLLTGSIKGKKRREIVELIKNNQVDVIVGTHALIQDEIEYSKLGFVVVDEQHRFGVQQRRILREKGLVPDVLFMTATPIPRTLSITAFGDMDVSTIDQMPVGRKPVKTYWAKEQMISRVLHFIEEEVKKGHQAYVICPLIEESEKLDIQNVLDVYQQLTAYFSPVYQVGLMHGRLSNEEKENVMREYAKNNVQVLVSTTVVEVGVNVPNATVMMIYDAERFGLAQLHQLRGRVGRGKEQSYCILLADPKTDVGKERMQVMTQTTDGFELSEFDLKLRGPGDFFGKKQSGLPDFKVADLVHDYRALETARKDAQQVIESGLLETEEFINLKKIVEQDPIFQGEILD